MKMKKIDLAITVLAMALGMFAASGAAAQDTLFVTPTGKVGVGTSMPAEKLQVSESVNANTMLVVQNPNLGADAAGALRCASDTATVNLIAHGSGRTLSRFGQTLGGWSELLQTTGSGLAYGTLGANPLIFGTNNVNRLHITASGEIGIGTSTPVAPLHVERETGATLEGITVRNNNEVRLTLQNTGLAATPKYVMAVNNVGDGIYFISRDGGGGTIVEISKRNDGDGVASFRVVGSVQATNVVFSSSRELKENFQAVDPAVILEKVAQLPITQWNYREGPSVQHIGPVAEDFQRLFRLSADTSTISVTDANGILLAAIQGLLQRVEALEEEVASARTARSSPLVP